MSTSLKLYVAQRLFGMAERALRNASRTDRDEAVRQLRQAIRRLEQHRAAEQQQQQQQQ